VATYEVMCNIVYSKKFDIGLLESTTDKSIVNSVYFCDVFWPIRLATIR
jgi:hypothetical protein